MGHLESLVEPLKYDFCVITGDFRGRLFGPYLDTLAQLASITRRLMDLSMASSATTIAAMVPGLEKLGI